MSEILVAMDGVKDGALQPSGVFVQRSRSQPRRRWTEESIPFGPVANTRALIRPLTFGERPQLVRIHAGILPEDPSVSNGAASDISYANANPVRREGDMTRGITVLLMTTAVLAFGHSTAAHHSFAAQYDREKPITLKGAVTRMEWANPHIYFYIDVESDGAKANWAIEGGAPSTLYRAGWRKDSTKVGDLVTVTGFLARDGSKLVNMQSAVLADGRNLFVGQQTYYPKGR